MSAALVHLWFIAASPDDADREPHISPARLVRDDRSAIELQRLAERIRAGDHAAFTTLVERYYDRVVRVASAVLRSSDGAQDVAQDVFVRLWNRRAALDPAQLTTTYVLAMAHHRALDEIRHGRIRERHQVRIVERPPMTSVPSDNDEQLRIEMVQAVVAALPSRWQLALQLRFQEQLSFSELAMVLEITSNAAHQLVHRAVRELRRRLGPPPGTS
jgi:RNA polymerase sigma-70 factor (ECF subfamily)